MYTIRYKPRHLAAEPFIVRMIKWILEFLIIKPAVAFVMGMICSLLLSPIWDTHLTPLINSILLR